MFSFTLGGRLNLFLQVGLGLLLLLGMALARRGWYRAHGVCQASAFVVAVVATVVWMVPSLREIYAPSIVRGVVNRENLVVVAHSALGSLTLLLAAYVILVAGTPMIPARLRFQNYRRWMRILLGLWWVTIMLGVVLYRLTSD